MYHLIVAASEVPPVPLELAGVSIRLLEKDPSTGAATVLTEMQPGSVIPEHWHRLADETVYVLAGEFVERARPSGRELSFPARPAPPTDRTVHRPGASCSRIFRRSWIFSRPKPGAHETGEVLEPTPVVLRWRSPGFQTLT